MNFDFAKLPPEINSTRMYSGPGSASMLAAASAWNQLAAELRSATTDLHNVVTALHSEEWVGPTSTLMSEAVAPYEAWMHTTIIQAEHAASQARMAAAAYETAFTGTVPPPLIAANRTELASLVSTNILGQNTAEIAALEASYAQMWAQDAAAMYEYAGSSAAASTVTPFSPPPQITKPGAAHTQAAAAARAAATGAGTARTTLAQMISEVPKALQSLASPLRPALNALGMAASETPIEKFLDWFTPLMAAVYSTVGLPYFGLGMINSVISSGAALGLTVPVAAGAVAADGAMGDLGALLGDGPMSASLGDAASIGKLSVPPSWAGPDPALSSVRVPPGVSDIVEPAALGEPGNLLGGMLPTAAGSAAARAAPRYGVRPTVMTRPPFAG